jgi:hypothetical protein
LVEEGSEGFMRDLVDNGMIEEKWVKEQIIRYQEETGNRLTTAESVDQMTYQQMVEAFSDMAVANFYNAHQQDKTGKLGAIINALRIFFAKVAKLAEELMILQKEGKIDADFQTLLDNSVGLNMDDQIARQTEEAQRDILGDATPSMSIGRTTITPTADTKVVEGSNATVVGEASFSIGAWHGTPHKVDKFKTENIGTGEGAQAYGYGLYFAESRGVAESYMDKFKGEQTFRMESDGKPLGIKIFTPQDVFAARKVEELGVTKAKDFFANIISNRESLIDSGVLDNDDIGDYEDALKLVENIPTGVTNIKLVEDFDSRIYKVELNVEQEQLLDWDKPLSEQSEMVRTSVAKLADHARGIINESGEVSHLRFVDRMQMEKLEGQYTYLALDILSTRKGLSELFARFGIKGIKYLDGTSRKDGEGTYNYVMFDDADIKITEENGKAVSMDEVESVSMSISPAQDAAYMDAVESGDVETQQRMVDEAAKRAGYDEEAFHGTDSDFDVFNISDKIGIWTGSEKLASLFSRMKSSASGKQARLIRAYIKYNNPATGGYNTQVVGEKAVAQREQLMSEGYDSIKVEGKYTIVFNPNQIKSADPVTYDADGNVIPLSQRFDASRDEISMSLAQAEDPVMSKIRSLMRDPEMREEVYRSMSERLQRVRDRVYAKHIAFGETTAESMKDAERQMSDREFITSSVAQVQAIVNVLPMEVRGKAGSILEIVKRSSSRGVTNELMKKIDKIDSILDKYMSDGYLDKLNKSRKQGKLKKGKQEKIARGTITAIKHNELDLMKPKPTTRWLTSSDCRPTASWRERASAHRQTP